MEILYKNTGVERLFSSKYKKTWRYPEQVKRKLEAAENAFIAAISWQDIANYPPLRLHPLKGEYKGQWSIYLGNTGYRVTLIPCNENGDTITSGDIMAQCKKIRVVMVMGVTNHYE